MKILAYLIMLIVDIIIFIPIIWAIKAARRKILKIRKEREDQALKQRQIEYDYLAKQIAIEQSKLRNEDE